MDRETARNAVLGLLGVLAVSLSAATLSNPLTPDSRDGGYVTQPAFDAPGAAVGETVVQVVAVVGALGLLVSLYHYRRTLFRRALLFVGVAGAWFLVLYFDLLSPLFPETDPRNPSNETGRAPVSNATSVNESGGSIAAQGEFQITIAWIALGLLSLSVLVIVFKWTTPDEKHEVGAETSPEGAAAVGRAAGRAADRIERNADVDNEVYRAWREMTGFLDTTSPEARTPGEFERAAVDVGLDRDDVRELTRLFERVRYGDHEPLDDDERRAVEIFRRIERNYGEDHQ